MLPNIKPFQIATVTLATLIALCFTSSKLHLSPLATSYAFSQSNDTQKDLVSLAKNEHNDLPSTVTLPTIFSTIVNDNYAQEAYLLYRIYDGDEYRENLTPDRLQAQKYLELAAELGHQDALLEMIEQSTFRFNFPGKYLDELAQKYINTLLDKYPDSPKSLIALSDLYATYTTHFYNPEKSFELILKASEISPSAENNYKLAQKYALALGTEQNLKQAISLLQENIANDKLVKDSQYALARLYFQFDISDEIEKDVVIDILKEGVERNKTSLFPDYSLAHYYADYLLEQDPINNKEYAFSLYQKTVNYFTDANIHHALALIKYKEHEKDQAMALILLMLESDKERHYLTTRERQNAYDLLFEHALEYPRAIQFIIEQSFNNERAKNFILPLLDQNPDVRFKYAIANVSRMSIENKVDENKLTSYYLDIIKAAELGSIDAMLFIIHGKIDDNFIPGALYYNNRFDQLTGTTQSDRLMWRNKCAEQGSNRCLAELGKLYQYGQSGVEKNYPKALEYYQRIHITPNKYEFLDYKSDMKLIEKEQQEFNELLNQYHNNDAEAAHRLADIYRLGKYGQKKDNIKWLNYLDQAANLGSYEALNDLQTYYENEGLLEKNRAKILRYYDQQIASGNQSAPLSLGLNYLYGLHLVNADRTKARELLKKSGKDGERYLSEMDSFDAKYNIKNKDADTNLQLGIAHTSGKGTNIDHLKARQYFKAAGEQGDQDAAYTYIRSLQNGIYDYKKNRWIVEPNWDEAISWLKKHPLTCCEEDELFRYNTLVLPALNNDINATLRLSHWYIEQQQHTAAAYWYNKILDKTDLNIIIPALDKIITNTDKKRELYSFGTLKNNLYSKVHFASLALSNKKVTANSELYQFLIQYLHEGLDSKDPVISNLAFNSLLTAYSNGTERYSYRKPRPKHEKVYVEFLESQSQKRTDALMLLAEYYTRRDPQKALAYAKEADEKGNIKAANYLFNFYLAQHDAEDENFERAIQYLKKYLNMREAADKENIKELTVPILKITYIANIYFEGFDDIARDLDKAIEMYQYLLKYEPETALEKLYEAHILNGNANEAYYYALILDKDIDNVTMFNTLTDVQREAIKIRAQNYIDGQNTKK
ncbi:sel1 repeat family protein [Providencia manganoxydans]|uniref:sel1 repeat family protein n=1 Tax=Providencia manganoxydans TaxID=2923283 RepID=UPI003AF35D75